MNETIINITNGVMFDINNNSLFSPNCIAECNKQIELFEKFKLDVIHNYEIKFVIVLCIIAVYFLYSMWIKYKQPIFSKSQFYLEYIEYRIDLVATILITFALLYIFLM